MIPGPAILEKGAIFVLKCCANREYFNRSAYFHRGSILYDFCPVYS